MRDHDLRETQPHGLAYGCQHTLQTRSPHLLAAAAVDGESAEGGREVPDVAEGDAGKLAAPAQREPAATEEGEEFIAAGLASVKTSMKDKGMSK